MIEGKIYKVMKKCKNFSTEKVATIAEEVDRLLAARFIQEAQYLEWLSNVVLVRKPNNKWRMCVDFTDLNKACPKAFPLPWTNMIIDSTAGHYQLSFMDAYSGYNQIWMNPDDEEKMTFITDRWLYYYRAMPFGLKNVGATYQCLVNQMFNRQVGHNMKVYINDRDIWRKSTPSWTCIPTQY